MTSISEKRQAIRSELIRRLTDMAPKHRLDAMLEEVDGRALVQSLAAEDVYATIVDVGLADSTEIVQLSTGEQFRTFVDLAAWQKDRVDPLEALHWLRAARGESDEEFIKKLQALDIELVELIFKKLTLIHDLEEDPDVNTEGVTMETPEGKLLIEFTVDGADEAALRRLSFDLMTHNPFELARFLEAVRWELPSELEEVAFQFRQARLQDLGFPTLEEAVKVFAWVDPDKFERASTTEVALSPTNGHVDLVAAAFRGLGAIERQNLEMEVRGMVNAVLVAEAAEPGDPAAVRRYSEYVRDHLDLAIEHCTGGDASAASDLVRDRSLKELFQIGFSLTLRLKRQVEKLAKEEGAKFGDTWLALDEETAVLSALLRRRPLKALKIPGAEPVPFRSKRELAEVETIQSRVRIQRSIFSTLLGPSPADTVARFGVSLAELSPQRLFAAVVARAEVDAMVVVEPFPQLKVVELCSRIFGQGSTLLDSAGQRASATLKKWFENPKFDPEIDGMVSRVLATLAKEMGATWARDARIDASKVVALPIAGEIPI